MPNQEAKSLATTIANDLPDFEAIAIKADTVKPANPFKTRFTKLLDIATSRKNILAGAGVMVLGYTQPWIAGMLIALAMILNTIEKACHLSKEKAELGLSNAKAATAEAEALKDIMAKL